MIVLNRHKSDIYQNVFRWRVFVLSSYLHFVKKSSSSKFQKYVLGMKQSQ